jgi:exonuclease SbcC
MRIEIVQPENVRSHVKSTVPFTKGFNCLVGGVGCGKSSIFYSIDFALFGDPIGRSYEYLLRDGASNGKVTVQFVQNGKNYTIVRGLKRRGKGISQDVDELKLFEGETLISSVKNEAISEQLKAITGLDKELFREIVWVRQEHLKEFLDAAPRDRQKRIDEMFGLSDYEVAWSNLALYQRDYENEKRIFEKDPDVTGMEKLTAEYNRVVEEFSLVEIDLQDTSKKLAIAKKALDEVDTKLKKLEQVKILNEELRRKETRILANLANFQDVSRSLTERIESKKTATRSFQQRLESTETQVENSKVELKTAGISPNQSVESLEQYASVLSDKITNLKGEQEATFRNMQEDKRRISSLSAENRCPLCLQPLSEEYRRDLENRIEEENGKRRESISRLQHDIEELQKTKTTANVVLSNLQKLTPRMEDLRIRISEESQASANLLKELAAKKKQEEDLHKQLDLVRLEISRFDMSELETTKQQKNDAIERYHSAEADVRVKQSRKKDLIKRMDETKERIDQAQEKIERMQKIAGAVEMIVNIRDAYRSIQPKLRSEFVRVLRNFVQQILDSLVGAEGPFLNVMVDETYTPYVKSGSDTEREVSNLSGGERTLLAFAYRLGLGQLIMQSRTGHGLSMLLLDEPTESLGREDGSIDRLAEAISRFKAIEQIIAVTHSEAFAEKAEHVIRLEKEVGESKVSVER